MVREKADEIKRHFDAVAEGLRSEIHIVAEELQKLREKLSGGFATVLEEINELKPPA